MARFNWKLSQFGKNILDCLRARYAYAKLYFNSLTHNEHMSAVYATDVCMEPIYWVVDNYTHLLGPFFVVAVSALTAAVVIIAYWIGLPYFWSMSPTVAVVLVIVGNWLLLNVVFHYVMGVITSPGYPPQDSSLFEAVSICKKCIVPKPPRTHHCSVCNRCILKMDHHCPWLNNCVGYGNQRYFFLYMVYTTLGCLFLVIFGHEIGYYYLWLDHGDTWTEAEPLEGQPVKFNLSGHIIPVTHINEYDDEFLLPAVHNLPTPTLDSRLIYTPERRRAIIFMAIVNVAVIIALGTLCIWHARLITRGETSIEAHINQSERKRLLIENKIYVNPYDYGSPANWRLFLGLEKQRFRFSRALRILLLPSWHKPLGNGLAFQAVHHQYQYNEWP